jgi:hypothetical protein
VWFHNVPRSLCSGDPFLNNVPSLQLGGTDELPTAEELRRKIESHHARLSERATIAELEAMSDGFVADAYGRDARLSRTDDGHEDPRFAA